MGAWGHGHFDNDSALDFVYEVESSNNHREMFEEAFDAIPESDYIDSDLGVAAIVAAAYIDNHVNGTKFSSAEAELEVDTFCDRFPDENLADLSEKAIAALSRVKGHNSELYGLWAESEEDGDIWKAGIEEMILRLQS